MTLFAPQSLLPHLGFESDFDTLKKLVYSVVHMMLKFYSVLIPYLGINSEFDIVNSGSGYSMSG